MCLAATTAVFKALVDPPGLKATLLAVADAAHSDETGQEWSTFATVEYIAHLCGRGVSTVRADLRRAEPEWLTSCAEYSGAHSELRAPRCTYILNKARILGARDPFFGEPKPSELELYFGRPTPKFSAGRRTNDPQPPLKASAGRPSISGRPALKFSTTGAEVQQTGAEVQQPHIRKERSLTVFDERGARTPFADHAEATGAVIDAAGLAEGEAALLRGFRFDAEAARLVAPDERAMRLIQERAGSALDDLGLRLACGALR